MKSAIIYLAKREFVEKIRTRYVIALMLAYSFLVVMYSLIVYKEFLDALNNVNIYNTTVIGIPKPVPDEVILSVLYPFVAFGPLFVIAISFGSLSYERNIKSLNLLLSLPVSRLGVLSGKIVGLTMVFVPVVVSLPAIMIATSLVSVGQLSGELALRIVCLEVVGILYLLFWLALTILISAVTSKPADSLAISATVWLVLQSNLLPELADSVILASVLKGKASQILTNPQWFSLNNIVASLVPPYRFVHAVFGSYLSVGFVSSYDLTPKNYVLDLSISFFRWVSAVSGDILVLVVSTMVLLLASHLAFSKIDL